MTMMHERMVSRVGEQTAGGASPSTPAHDRAGGRSHPRARGIVSSFLLTAASLAFWTGLIVALWEWARLSGVIPSFILPAPSDVLSEFWAETANGSLLSNAGVTLQEAFAGFGVAAVIAAVSGYAIVHNRVVEAIATPFIGASQAVPVVAVAPLIVLLVGTGLPPKVIVCAVIVVFPLLIGVIAGLRGVARDYHDVARVFGASPLQTLWYVDLPLAAPTLLAGARIGVTLSLTGAVVGEFVAADSGLGFAIDTAIGNAQKAPAFAALLALIIISVALFGLITLIERLVLQWLDVVPS